MTGEQWLIFVVFPLVAYGIGSTPFGIILARSKGVDLRSHGSGNVGATNVGRVLGGKWGYLCFFLDTAKGLAPVLAVGLYLRRDGSLATAEQLAWIAVAFSAVMGHVLSFWLRFRGGKGVATGLGAVLGVWPFLTAAGAAALLLWILVTLISRYVSLGSILAALAFSPLFAGWNCLRGDWQTVLDLWPLGLFALMIAVVVVVRHRSNISRLLAGTESKISARKG